MILKKITCFLSLVTIVLLSFGCSSDAPSGQSSKSGTMDEKAVEYPIYTVSARSGLRIRRAPNLKSVKMALIPFESEVQLVEESEKEMSIEGLDGKWVKIKYKNLTGWVFNGFLNMKNKE